MQQLRNMSGTERTTVVKRRDLLAKLRANARDHLAQYNLAVEGYLDEARLKLEEQFAKAQNELRKAYERTKEELKHFDPQQARDSIIFCRSIAFDLTAPRNYSAAYDQVIEMLEWDTRDEIELSASEFRCFVMDKWDWMEEFRGSTVKYAMAARSKSV